MNKEAHLTLNSIRFRAKSANKETVELTAVEFRILSLFIKNKFRPLAKDRILNEVWAGNKIEKKTINVHLSHLRKKLHLIGRTITHLERSTFAIESLDTLIHKPRASQHREARGL